MIADPVVFPDYEGTMMGSSAPGTEVFGEVVPLLTGGFLHTLLLGSEQGKTSIRSRGPCYKFYPAMSNS